jgi:hypothetical protein
VRDAKLWLTLGALAATASASFWLGRLSTPAELAPAGLAGAELAPAGLAPTELVSARVGPALDVRTAASLMAPAPEAGARPAAGGALSPANVAASPLDPSDRLMSSGAPSLAIAAGEVRAPARTSLPHAMLSLAKLPPEPAVRERAGARAQRSLGLAAEIEQLARAEAALRQGRAAHALVVLERGSVRHLLEQAAALRAIAECELGLSTAAGSARDVLERWPASAFQPRIARACR